MTALAKMTLLPADRMARAAPAMARKGRLEAGCDADITVFDPRTVADRATYKEPKQFSTGVRWLFVNGVPVVREGHLVEDAHPGRPIWGRGRTSPSIPHAFSAPEVRPAMKARIVSKKTTSSGRDAMT
jgi:dihydroorotase